MADERRSPRRSGPGRGAAPGGRRRSRASARGPDRGGLVSTPSSQIVPLSGWWTPARILTSVLLPAPFSPTSAWTSPGSRSSDTSSSAWVAANRFEIPRSSARGGAAVAIVASAVIAGLVRVRAEAGVSVVGPDEPDVDATRSQGARPSPRARASSVRTTSISSVGQNVANAARSHFVCRRCAMTSRAAATIERLIWASSSVASARPDSSVKPAAPRNAFWTLIRLNSPSPSWPTTESASQRTRPPSMSTVMPRDGRPAPRRAAARS